MAGLAQDGRSLARELEDVREQQRAISGVLRAVARSAGLQPVLDEAAEACKRLSEADHGALWLLEDGFLHLGAHHGEPEGARYDQEHPHALDRTTAAGRAGVERKPVQIPDVLADPEYTYPGPRFFRTMLGVPIMFEDALVGVVVVVRREAKPFTDDHVALVPDLRRPGRDRPNERAPDRGSRTAADGALSLRLAASGRSDLERRRATAPDRTPRLHLVPLL